MFATSIGRMLCRNQHIFASACKSCAISVQFCRAYGHHGRSFALRHRIMFKEREFRAGAIASPRRFIRTHTIVVTRISIKIDFQSKGKISQSRPRNMQQKRFQYVHSSSILTFIGIFNAHIHNSHSCKTKRFRAWDMTVNLQMSSCSTTAE